MWESVLVFQNPQASLWGFHGLKHSFKMLSLIKSSPDFVFTEWKHVDPPPKASQNPVPRTQIQRCIEENRWPKNWSLEPQSQRFVAGGWLSYQILSSNQGFSSAISNGLLDCLANAGEDGEIQFPFWKCKLSGLAATSPTGGMKPPVCFCWFPHRH